jgi:hypothetical protein
MFLLLASVLGAIFILPAIYTLMFRHRDAKLAASAQSGPVEPAEPEIIDEIEDVVLTDSELYGT